MFKSKSGFVCTSSTSTSNRWLASIVLIKPLIWSLDIMDCTFKSTVDMSMWFKRRLVLQVLTFQMLDGHGCIDTRSAEDSGMLPYPDVVVRLKSLGRCM